VNRERRRELEKRRVRVLVGVRSCERCGAPYCPECDVECPECECCGEFNCEQCGAYVIAASWPS
jgi:hypothetical protein